MPPTATTPTAPAIRRSRSERLPSVLIVICSVLPVKGTGVALPFPVPANTAKVCGPAAMVLTTGSGNVAEPGARVALGKVTLPLAGAAADSKTPS